MDNLDITPAFIDVFNRLNKHIDLLPFQKLLNDQNSTLTKEEKQELITKIKESAKKIRQLNLVLDELKDQLVDEIEKVQNEYEEKNRELDELEEHLNFVRLNRFNQKTTSNHMKSSELETSVHDLNDSTDEDQKKENMNRFMNQPIESNTQNFPKKSLKKPASHFKQPDCQIKSTNSSIKGGAMRKPAFENQSTNQLNRPPIKPAQPIAKAQPQQPKNEKIKNVDAIYINYPQINYISLSEFNYIPDYMRGRLTFDTCIKLVDEFNKSVETKYKFMMIPSTKYTNEELIKYTLYKNQENDETRGRFFVTPKDLHDYSDLKISVNNTKLFIQCIRHCKRIKEIRGTDKVTRYVVLN